MAIYVVVKHCDVHLPGEMIIHTPEDEKTGINAARLVERGALRKARKGEDTSSAVPWGTSSAARLRQVPPVPVDAVMDKATQQRRAADEASAKARGFVSDGDAEARAKDYATEAPVEQLTTSGTPTNTPTR